ncbi:MAG: hypothetical protein ACYC61_03380 [Isosphaeraceae bacterium]
MNAREQSRRHPKRKRVLDLIDEGAFDGLLADGGDEADDSGDSDIVAADEVAGDRSLSLESAAQEYVWLYDFRRGIACQKIAEEYGLTVREVRDGIERARKLEARCSRDGWLSDLQSGREVERGIRLMPMFPIGEFTPQSTCPHGGPLRRGSTLCCMVCHASGMDGHPSLRHDPATDPRPESGSETQIALPRAADAGPLSTSARRRETRRERRRERRRRMYESAAAI